MMRNSAPIPAASEAVMRKLFRFLRHTIERTESKSTRLIPPYKRILPMRDLSIEPPVSNDLSILSLRHFRKRSVALGQLGKDIRGIGGMDLFHVAATQENFPPVLQRAGFGAKLAYEFHVDDQAPGDGKKRIAKHIPDLRLRHADLDDRSILQVQIMVMRAALRILDLIRKQHLLNAGGTDNMHPPPSGCRAPWRSSNRFRHSFSACSVMGLRM